MKYITEEINELKNDIPKLAKLSDEYLFSLLCYKYFYNNGRLDYKDFVDCFVDGRDDGGIDLIAIDDSDIQVHLVLVQSKFTSTLANKQDIIDVFTKMDQTFTNFQEHRTAKYNKKLKRTFKEKISLVEDQTPVYELALFTSLDPSKERKTEIENELSYIEELSKYEINIFYLNEIKSQIQTAKEPKFFVDEHSILFSRESGIIKYGDNGRLINVWAHSIRDLFDLYRDKGLFEQNFRYFVRNKRIDDAIKDSLEKKRDSFWFLNNGIIIGCKDFMIDGNEVKLYDFSIINGCQTATLIGQYKGKDEDKNFLIPCKIVRPSSETNFENFITEIAEASNSQKPILDRDLKSNRPEQRQLQKSLKERDPKVYIEIKRGEQLISQAKKKQLPGWCYLKNDLYGQIVLSFNLQAPGTARSSKRSIFAVSKYYDRIFKRKINKDNIIDILKLHNKYEDYLDRSLKEEKYSTAIQESIATNGKFIILAIIGFMLKEKHGLVDITNIKNEEEWENEVIKDNFNIEFLNDKNDDFSEKLGAFFTDIIQELEELYMKREEEEKTVSNFFKTDIKYRNVILDYIVKRYYTKGSLKEKDRDYYLLQLFK